MAAAAEYQGDRAVDKAHHAPVLLCPTDCRRVNKFVVMRLKAPRVPGGENQFCVKLIVASQSRQANYLDGMSALLAALDDRLQSGSKAVSDNVRRNQIGSGMRGDKRRTYRFKDDTVVDHATGKSMPASKAMKGGLAALW